MDEPIRILVDYDSVQIAGRFRIEGNPQSSLWDRMLQAAADKGTYRFIGRDITLSWPDALALIREFAPTQRKRRFRFITTASAKPEIAKFVAQHNAVRKAQREITLPLTEREIAAQLKDVGFTKRTLRPFQMRDLRKLLALKHGANFSVPGAGKTTVTFALHLITGGEDGKIIVVSPKSAFQAWREVVNECVAHQARDWVKEPFRILTGGAEAVRQGLMEDSNRFVINYEQLFGIRDVFRAFLIQNAVHLVLDESHRIKGGLSVRRAVVLMNAASLPVRRDILSGTPMPQSSNDLKSQLDFLWPGAGLGLQIAGGRPPRQVIGNLYARTTKEDLALPAVARHFRPVSMSTGQSALYGIVRSELLRDNSTLRSHGGSDIIRARRSVIRLLQLSANPVLALKAMMATPSLANSGIAWQVLEDGPSPKMLAVRDLARSLAQQGRKSVIWTIFTDTIKQMQRMVADLNPVTLYGAVPSGSPLDPATREGRLKRFHEDTSCMVLIANPAAAGEGINLHHICHDAIYLDRSYNSTHYLQSIDRIHRLGLPEDVETNVYIFQTMAPKGLGAVDHSVSRRLAVKMRAMQRLLNDADLHQLALDEEEVDEVVDYSISRHDLIDLIAELEGSVSYDADATI